jgi:hypothetical protein
MWFMDTFKTEIIQTKQASRTILQCSSQLSKADAVPCEYIVGLQNFDKLRYYYVTEVIFMSFKTFKIIAVKYNCT